MSDWAKVDDDAMLAPQREDEPGTWCRIDHGYPGITNGRTHWHPAVRTREDGPMVTEQEALDREKDPRDHVIAALMAKAEHDHQTIVALVGALEAAKRDGGAVPR